MATTYTTNLALPVPAAGDSGWAVTLTDLFAILDLLAPCYAGLVRPSEAPSTTLNVDVVGFTYRKADGTLGTYAGITGNALPASTTRYLYLTNAGVLTVATGSFPTGSPIVRLAVVTTTATKIDSIVDARVVLEVAS